MAGTFATGLLLAASGAANPSGVGGVTAPGAGEVRTLSETIPAGGTVQVKYLLTQPRPISTGGPRKLATDGFLVNGIGITSPNGDAAGVGLVKDGFLSVTIISPDSDYGMNLDYPFLTVAMTIPATTPKGSSFPLDFTDAVFQTPTGQLTLVDPKPGTLTIGGSVSVHGLVPGGGIWPAGTVIKVEGTGFQPGTKLITKLRTTNPIYVSPTEMRFSLIQGDILDMQPVTAQNPDGSKATYFSYLRGVLVQPPSRALLNDAEPIFQGQTHAFAIVGPIAALAPTDFIALAIQNPTAGPVVVTFHHDQSGITTSVTLPSCGRVVEDLAKLLGMSLSAGDTVTVTSTAAVQIVGINGNEIAQTVSPFLPAF